MTLTQAFTALEEAKEIPEHRIRMLLAYLKHFYPDTAAADVAQRIIEGDARYRPGNKHVEMTRQGEKAFDEATAAEERAYRRRRPSAEIIRLTPQA